MNSIRSIATEEPPLPAAQHGATPSLAILRVLLAEQRVIRGAIADPYSVYVVGAQSRMAGIINSERRPRMNELWRRQLVSHDSETRCQALQQMNEYFRTEVIACLEAIPPDVRPQVEADVIECVREAHGEAMCATMLREAWSDEDA